MSKRKKKISVWFKKLREAWVDTYTKRIVTLITVNAIGWVWASYILAYLGRYQIAENLAREVVTAIIAVVLTYSVKSLAENVSKNGFKGKQAKTEDKPFEGGGKRE